jgi:hypothetical protein
MLSRRPVAFYNAGTDILGGDPLGHMDVTREGVLSRDRFVLEALAQRGIPAVVLTSGDYTSHSHALIAESIRNALETPGSALTHRTRALASDSCRPVQAAPQIPACQGAIGMPLFGILRNVGGRGNFFQAIRFPDCVPNS